MLSFLLYSLAGLASAIALIALFAIPCIAFNLVPASVSRITLLSAVPWMLYGNDDGGLYGERDWNWVYNLGHTEPTFKTAFLWWLRNPLHNLMFHVLRWERDTALVAFECPPMKAWHERPARNWVTESGPSAQLVLVPFFFSWRAFGMEGYIGWREGGTPGMALRTSDRS